jgi:hypothetical protein
VLGEVGEVPPVEGQQRQPALDAAGRDPGVVQRPGPTASLCSDSELTTSVSRTMSATAGSVAVPGPLLLAHLLEVVAELFHLLVGVEQVAERLQRLGAVLEP